MRSTLFVLLVAAAVGCGKGSASNDPSTSSGPPSTTTPMPGSGPDPVAKAKEVFTQRCVTCHGATGVGDGPASASLNPKPRAFSDPAWQASVTDDHITKIIKFGGAAVGKSAAMPNNPDLSDPAVIGELVKIVRAFKK